MAARFDAFISYSRRASSGLTTDLQTAVERFAKPWYRMRAVRVFRDDASMSANTALWSNIERGLQQAEWFVLVASPAAAASEYVGNEVTWWLQHKSSDRIIIVLEEGVDIAWDREANDFDWSRTDSLPRALSEAFAEEPRWIDLRWYEADGSLKKADPRWDERVADIAAAVRFAERDQLIGENVREHRKARRLLRAGVVGLSVLLVASLVATFVAVGQRSEAQRQTKVAVEQRREATRQATIALARQLAAQAVSLAPSDLRTASLLAVQAYRTNADSQTRAALFAVATRGPQLAQSLPAGARVTATAATADGVVVTGDEEGGVKVWEGATPSTAATMDGEVSAVATSTDGTVVAAADGSAVVLWSGGQARVLDGAKGPAFVAVSPDGSRVAATSPGRTGAWVWEVSGGEQPRRVAARFASELAFSSDGLVSFGPTGEYTLADPVSGDRLRQGGHAFGFRAVGAALSADGRVMAGSLGAADLPVWRGDAAYSNNVEPNAVASIETPGQDIALSETGVFAASVVEGVIEVARVRSTSESFVRPLRLEGVGAGSFGSLSFGGDRFVVNGSGDVALVWDLEQDYRLGIARRTYVPEPCGACGLQQVEVSPDGERVLMWARGGAEGPVVTDIASGDQVLLDRGNRRSLEGLTWVADNVVVGWDASQSRLVTIDASNGTATASAELPLTEGEGVIAARSDGATDGLVTVLTGTGAVYVVDLDAAEVVDRSSALVGRFEQYDVALAGIAPDGTSVFVQLFDTEASAEKVLALDLDSDAVFDPPGIAAAYDGRSELHVFDGEVARVLGEDGELGAPVPAAVSGVTPPPILQPDGELLVTGGSESDIRIVELDDDRSVVGTMEVPNENGTYPVSAFTPDGSQLVTAIPAMFSLGLPASLRRVPLDPAEWITAACQVAARDLTEEDWARYGVGRAPSDLRCVQ